MKQWFAKLKRPVLPRRRAGLALGLAVLMVISIAVADFFAGEQVSLSLFYLVPICFVTWFLGRNGGVSIAIVSMFAVVVELQSSRNPSLTGHPYIVFWRIFLPLGFMLTIVYLLDSLHLALVEVHHLASTDALTGVFNRRAFLERVNFILHLAARESVPTTLIYIDLDNFKDINDAQGHDAGDSVLKSFAATLSGTVRGTDLVCRLGGDEFALLLPDTDSASAKQFVLKMRQAVSLVFGAAARVTCSIGCVTFWRAPASAEEALHAADRLMYEVKASGKDEIRFGEIGSRDDIVGTPSHSLN